ncbi:MAG: dynamin family protein [Spirochaetaceae bacterium]|jgi:GTPase SAR1 family protein|nr:dynamin family protein [Spirochaetaceae bacterium]
MANQSAAFVQKAGELQNAFKEVQKLFQPDFINRWTKEVEQYKEFAENPVFQVAVVGAIKAGKSTLLNAMLGEELTSTEVTPETASLTIFKYSPENYVKVKFLSRLEWDELWASATKKADSIFAKEFQNVNGERYVNEWAGHKEIEEKFSSIEKLKTTIKRYSSSKSGEHYFVKELEIGLSQFPDFLPREIVLVDTPGLDDVVPYRSEITTHYISRANAVIVCVNAKFLANEQYVTLTKVFEQVGKGKKILVLGTQADTFQNPKRDWEKQKLEWEKYLEDLYKDPALMRKNLIGVSSYIFSLIKKLEAGKDIPDTDITNIAQFAKGNEINIPSLVSKEDILKAAEDGNVDMDRLLARTQKKIIKEKAADLLACTNIPAFFNALNDGPLQDSTVELQNDLTYKYQSIENEVKNQALDVKASIEEQVTILSGTVEEKESAIRQKGEEFKNLSKYATEVEDSFTEMRKKVNAAIEDVKSKLDSELKKVVGV